MACYEDRFTLLCYFHMIPNITVVWLALQLQVAKVLASDLSPQSSCRFNSSLQAFKVDPK
jgi:hypothetical protein